MRFKDRKRITRLAIPLKHIVRGNEKIIMEVIAGAFKNVEVITLIAGDSEDDAQVSFSYKPNPSPESNVR